MRCLAWVLPAAAIALALRASDAFVAPPPQQQRHLHSTSDVQRCSTILAAKAKKGPAKARPKGTPVNIDVVTPFKLTQPSVIPEQPRVSAEEKKLPQAGKQEVAAGSKDGAAAGVEAAAPPFQIGALAEIPNVVPRLVVFDLDKTCWLPEMFQLKGAPFRVAAGRVLDREGTEVALRPDVRTVLEELYTHPGLSSTRIACASRTNRGNWSRQVMELFVVFDGLLMSELFDFVEIQPGDKTAHFDELTTLSKVPYDEMLFFDDWERNIKDVSPLGVTCVHCPEGLTKQVSITTIPLHVLFINSRSVREKAQMNGI
eukprot:TRINITY_DN418_c0_g2_i2.p1 TRINITY_DN418_c0_g2~~TRINITY_DN418_c0_g2_i2.p1  ORF type:complete len:330 (-),score=85.60 TRINITY_DN418_c0_g2_i2:73-1014(-)